MDMWALVPTCFLLLSFSSPTCVGGTYLGGQTLSFSALPQEDSFMTISEHPPLPGPTTKNDPLSMWDGCHPGQGII